MDSLPCRSGDHGRWLTETITKLEKPAAQRCREGEDAALIDAAPQRGLEILPLLYAGETGKAMTRLNARS